MKIKQGRLLQVKRMRRTIKQCMALVIVALVLTACAAPPRVETPAPAATTGSSLAFAKGPAIYVVYADLKSDPGAPPSLPEGCSSFFLPVLRIWSDGLVYLRTIEKDGKQPAELGGTLSQDQISQVLLFLSDKGFMNNWQHAGPNPSGTALKLGVNLADQTIEYETGDLSPSLYKDLVNILLPDLASLSEKDINSARISRIQEQYLKCGAGS